MSKIPDLREQRFGNRNNHLNQIRAEMNNEITGKCFDILRKKKSAGDKNAAII